MTTESVVATQAQVVDLRRRRITSAAAAGAVLSLWVALIAWAIKRGYHARGSKHLQLGNAAPFFGRRREFGAQWALEHLWPAAVVALLVVACAHLLIRLRWLAALGVTWLAATAWAVLLASSDGWHAFGASMSRSTEYRPAIKAVGANPLRFVHTFTTALHTYPTQVKGHPPLPTLALWVVERLGLHGPAWSAAVVIAVGSSAVVAAAITVRAVASEDLARRALPWLILAPGTAWVATSMDSLFLGVGAWGIALLALAAQAPGRQRAIMLAIAGGVVLGCVPYLSYGLLPLGSVALAGLVLARRREARLARWVWASAVVGFAAVVGAFTAAGFWWPAGVAATNHLYRHNYGSGSRPYGYFLFANLAVFALMVGPASAVALTRLWRTSRPLTWLVAAALLAIAVSDASGYMRGEVERIWLPYSPWVVIAGVALRRRTPWLLAQVLTALAVQALVVSPW
jgi:hypothetical protein